MVKAKKYIYQKPFDGLPNESNFKLVEEELPPLKDGEFLAKASYLSVDPYMRVYASDLPIGATFLGSQVAEIIESKNPSFPIGKHVVGQFGWRNYTISNGKHEQPKDFGSWLLPDTKGLPISLALGVLGMPGNSAYFGFVEICKPKPGDLVVVTGAAGAVGSIVGQIAKIKGCTVIGITGSDEKGKWLLNTLNFDYFINYKNPNFENELAKIASSGIDCYFDNVGGEISSTIIRYMKEFGRISVCGSISNYNAKIIPKTTEIQPFMIKNQLVMEGFIVHRWKNRWFEGIEQNQKWIKEGKLKYKETVTEGFENMVQAFVEMLQGKNFGKAIIKA